MSARLHPEASEAARYVLRPAGPGDLAALERIAAARAIGINSLPSDSAQLLDKLERSAFSFASEDEASGEETYLFVLVDTRDGGVVGSSGIAASAGFHDRFYSYRNEFLVQASPELGIVNKTHTLHLCHDLTGVTLLTSFWIDPALEATAWPQLLSRARLLYIAAHRERFADRIAAESPGLSDEQGRCAFWDAVGRRFFDMDYPAAERLTGGRSKAFIAELMPQAPIYVPLLPEAAQLAIGQLHPVSELPFSILIDEGFDADSYIDIFDGGPTAEARFEMLRTVRHLGAARIAGLIEVPLQSAGRPGAGWALLANGGGEDFRATLAPIARSAPGAIDLAPAAAATLVRVKGATLQWAPLSPPRIDLGGSSS
ncbi:arginine N-succinyltransferase [Rivibacter subsaxonicus]|uniref:Arginine succinyltransferase n=1 Tax=Rivibacter subsaxonicus TaxID=457575 RepID=A0A4Q7W0C9_9BURK|nr:arginine N-succinyltransferase [Rivibacter subsaxonicus]RZU02617.1 arginine succinyltransferase [Rivibacter subsaxonicus]